MGKMDPEDKYIFSQFVGNFVQKVTKDLVILLRINVDVRSSLCLVVFCFLWSDILQCRSIL